MNLSSYRDRNRKAETSSWVLTTQFSGLNLNLSLRAAVPHVSGIIGTESRVGTGLVTREPHG